MTPTKRFPKAFIIRPFGEKEILLKLPAGAKDTEQKRVVINFDDIEAKLIKPAMERAGLTGATTQEFVQAGSIPRDMFQRLLTAELVIADISIHNANVFYELGIRHALRDKRTFLLRCKVEGHETPFDIRSERFLVYDREDPAKGIDELVRGLQATVESSLYDSPMYTYLPDLAVQDFSRFILAPDTFTERIRAAQTERRVGDIQFLADEVALENWGVEALRLGARAQVSLNAWLSAARLWQQVLNIRGHDAEAELNLGNVYVQAGKYLEAEETLARLRKAPLNPELRSRTYGLSGQNAMRRWVVQWKGADNNRAERALKSPFLRACWQSHLEAFESDLHDINHGINALLAGTVLLDLVDRYPGAWSELFEDDEATAILNRIKRSVDGLPSSLNIALSRAEEREKAGKLEPGSMLRCQAELSLVTSRKVGTVADKYRTAAVSAERSLIEQMRERLLTFQDLGVLVVKSAAALDAINESISLLPSLPPVEPPPGTVVVFMGLREQDLGVGSETALQEAIKRKVEAIEPEHGHLFAISGGSPAEIVFHEVCEGLLLGGEICVTYDTAAFRLEYERTWSIEWMRRYDAVIRRRPFWTLQNGPDPPAWLPPGHDVRARTNQWIMHNALRFGCPVVLLVLDNRSAEAEAALRALLMPFKEQEIRHDRINLDN